MKHLKVLLFLILISASAQGQDMRYINRLDSLQRSAKTPALKKKYNDSLMKAIGVRSAATLARIQKDMADKSRKTINGPVRPAGIDNKNLINR